MEDILITRSGVKYQLLTPFTPDMSDFESSHNSMDVICGSCGQRRGSHYTVGIDRYSGRSITRCPIMVNGVLQNPEVYGAEHHDRTFFPAPAIKDYLDDSFFSID